MPSRTYMQVDPRRDHAFAIPRPERHRALGSTDACATCHAQGADWATAAVTRWRGDRPRAPHWSDALVRDGVARTDPTRWAEVAASPRATDWVRGSAWMRLALEAPVLPDLALLERDHALASRGPLERLGLVELLRRATPREQARRLLPFLEDDLRAIRVSAAEALSALPVAALRPAERSALARALHEYRAAQAANADRPEAQVNLGTLAARQGDLGAARAGYEKAIARAPYFVPAHVNLADVARGEGRDAEAVAHLRRALDLDPDDARVRYALGLALHRVGDTESSLEALARAASDAPGDPRLVLGYALALAGAGRGEEAKHVLEAAIERGAGDPVLHHTLVGLWRDEGALEEARSRARRFRDRFPTDPRARAWSRELGL